MIYRISISVNHPLPTAIALAEIWGSTYFALPPLPNSYAVLPAGDCGTAIEIYPIDTEVCITDAEMAAELFDALFKRPTTLCGAVSVAATSAEIRRIANCKGWQVRSERFGLFEIVELWVENRCLLELLPRTQPMRSHQTLQPLANRVLESVAS